MRSKTTRVVCERGGVGDWTRTRLDGQKLELITHTALAAHLTHSTASLFCGPTSDAPAYTCNVRVHVYSDGVREYGSPSPPIDIT